MLKLIGYDKESYFYIILLFAFSGVLCAQTAANAHKFVYDTNVFERGYWEAKSGDETYKIQFRKDTKDIREELNIKDDSPDFNSKWMVIQASYTYLINGKVIYQKEIKGLDAPFFASEYTTENRLIMDYKNPFFKELGEVCFTISPSNPDMMIWFYSRPKKGLIYPIGDYNQGEQKTPTHLVFYRKTE